MSLISEIPNQEKEVSIWLTKQLHAKIAERNSFSMRASRHSTKKRVSKTNRKDALPAELQKNSNREVAEITEKDIKKLFEAKKVDYIIHFYLYRKTKLEVFDINNKKNELLINNEITEKEIRLIDSDGSMLGIVPTSEALELAFQKNLDLVKISPNAVPPVCKIADYNKSMYEKAKKDKEAKKNQKVVTLKEIRLSAKIEEHDLDFKVKNAHKFLSEGNKVKASIRFKGRQQKYTDDGFEVLSKFAESLKEVGIIDKAPSLEGRIMSIILSPKNS